jgi:hypothetical protein
VSHRWSMKDLATEGQHWTRLPRRPPRPSLVERSRALDRCLVGGIWGKISCERLTPPLHARQRRKNAKLPATAEERQNTTPQPEIEIDRVSRAEVATDCAGSVWDTNTGAKSPQTGAPSLSWSRKLELSHGSGGHRPAVERDERSTLSTIPRALFWASRVEDVSLEAIATRLVVEEERAWQDFRRCIVFTDASAGAEAISQEIAASSAGIAAQPLMQAGENVFLHMLCDQDNGDGELLGNKVEAFQSGRRMRKWKRLAENTILAAENFRMAAKHDRKRCLEHAMSCLVQHLVQGFAEIASHSRLAQHIYTKWRSEVVETEHLRMRGRRRLLRCILKKLVIHTAARFETRLVVSAAASRRARQHFSVWTNFASTSHRSNNVRLHHQHQLLASCFVAWGRVPVLGLHHQHWLLLSCFGAWGRWLALGSMLTQSAIDAKAACLEELGLHFRLDECAGSTSEIFYLRQAIR